MSPPKSVDQFIEEHRQEIDSAILGRGRTHGEYGTTDEQRRAWIMRDLGLYIWAKSEGVDIWNPEFD